MNAKTITIAPKATAPAALMDKVGVYYLDASRTGIIFSFGRKWMHAVSFTNPTTCVEIERDAQLRPVLLKGLPYPVQDAARRFLAAGFSITERATKVLTNLLNNEAIEEAALELMPNLSDKAEATA